MNCRFLKALRRSRERTADHIRPAAVGLVLAFAGASVLAQADQHLAFLQSQAAHIEPNVYRIRYASIQYPNLVPVDTSAAPFAGQITYYSEDGTGSMEFLANRGNDFPMVSLSMEQKNVRIKNLGIGYEYDMFELGQAEMLGLNLSDDKARIARRVSEEKIDTIVMSGASLMGWDGLVNSTMSGLTRVDAETGTAGSNNSEKRLWKNKSGLEMLADVQQALQDVWSTSSTVELADTVLLSPARFATIASKPIGDNTDKSVLDYLMKYNAYTAQTGQPLMIRTCRELADRNTTGIAAASATGIHENGQRMVVYRRDIEVLRLHMPMPFQFLEPVKDILTYKVPGVMRLGGLEIRLPGAERYEDGI